MNAQSHICNNSYEFPIIKNVKTNEFIDQINQKFKEDNLIDVETYGIRQAQAYKLMKKAGWN